MTKLYWITIIVICAISIWITEKAFSKEPIIILPDETILRCTTLSDGTVICQ